MWPKTKCSSVRVAVVDDLGVEPGVVERSGDRLPRLRSPEPEGVHGRDDVRAVAVGEHRVAQLGADLGDPVVPGGGDPRTASAHEHLVGDAGQQHLLARDVVVERARLDPQLGTEPAHGQVGQPVAVEDVERPVDHVRAVVAHLTPPIRDPALTGSGPDPNLNAVHLTNVQVSAEPDGQGSP